MNIFEQMMDIKSNIIIILVNYFHTQILQIWCSLMIMTTVLHLFLNVMEVINITKNQPLPINFQKVNYFLIATFVVSSTQVFSNIGPGRIPQLRSYHMDLDFWCVLERAVPQNDKCFHQMLFTKDEFMQRTVVFLKQCLKRRILNNCCGMNLCNINFG